MAEGHATIAVWDPVLSEREAAEYCGGVSVTTLQRMQIPRSPLPCRGRKRVRHGYRLSALNDFLARLQDPKARGLIREEPTAAEADRILAAQRRSVEVRRERARRSREAQSA